MPHFIAKKENINFPLQEGDFIFHNYFIDEKYPSQGLISVTRGKDLFFLRKNKHPLGFLFKAEKNTRPSLTGHLKDALSILSKHCEIISHNLSKNTPKQTTNSPFLLNPADILTQCNQPFMLEIGFGSGRHLLNLARKNPQLLCLGIEIHTPSIQQVLRQIEILNLKNLFISNLDARILTQILPSNLCEKIFIHFPVPWNKKPHRRVLTKDFLTQALRILAPNKTLHLRTDDEIYFQDALSLALNTHQSSFSINKNITQEIISKYEARWIKQQKNIYDLEFKSLHFDQEISSNYDFSFPYSKEFNFPERIIEKDFFIHLNARFFSKDSILLSISFGDFNWPNTRFIQIDHQNHLIKFLGQPPLAIPANIKAHKRLITYLENQ